MEDILQQVTEGLKHYEYGIEFGVMDNYGMSPALQKEMLSLLLRLNKPQKNLPALTAEIKKYIEKYPHILPFQNFLYSAYMQAGQDDKANAVNEKTLAEHPDYLIGIINRAAGYLMAEEYEKIPEVLGHMLEIGELQPDREKFHIIEYMSFNKIVVLYACAIENIELAKNRFELMEKIAPERPETEETREAIKEKEFELKVKGTWNAVRDMFNKPNDWPEYNEIEYDYLSQPQTTDKPEFNHPQIEELYRFSLDISAGLMQEILSLPRKTLIQDLETVIYDSIRRFEYFAEEDLISEETFAAIHAMVLLAELKSVESVPVMLETLRQGEEYLDYWFGDLLTEDIWDIYYQVFELGAYISYLQEPRHNTYAKNMIADVIFRKTEAAELKQEEALNAYQLLLQYFIDNRENADILDSNFMGGLMADICNLKLTALLPTIKTCFDYKLVDEWICGDYESIEKDIYEKGGRRKSESKLATGYANYYADINRSIVSAEEAEYEPVKDEDFEVRLIEDKRPAPVSLVIPQKAIAGRNDPCPCGSGKKYKKCCMN